MKYKITNITKSYHLINSIKLNLPPLASAIIDIQLGDDGEITDLDLLQLLNNEMITLESFKKVASVERKETAFKPRVVQKTEESVNDQENSVVTVMTENGPVKARMKRSIVGEGTPPPTPEQLEASRKAAKAAAKTKATKAAKTTKAPKPLKSVSEIVTEGPIIEGPIVEEPEVDKAFIDVDKYSPYKKDE